MQRRWIPAFAGTTIFQIADTGSRVIGHPRPARGDYVVTGPRVIGHPWPARGDDILSSLLLPGTACVLIVPAGMRPPDPLLGERGANLRFPFGVAIGERDFVVGGLAIAVFVGNRGVQCGAFGKWHAGRITY